MLVLLDFKSSTASEEIYLGNYNYTTFRALHIINNQEFSFFTETRANGISQAQKNVFPETTRDSPKLVCYEKFIARPFAMKER